MNKMNNRIAVIGAIVTVLLLLAACNQTVEPRGTVPARTAGVESPETTPSEETAPSDVPEEQGSVFKSLKDAMGASVPMKCTWTSSEGSGEVTVKGKKFRTEASVSGMTAYSVSDGTYMYSWASNQKRGVKFNLNEMAQVKQQPGSSSALDLEKKMDYSCAPAAITDSDFVPPSDVEFADMSQLVQQYANYSAPTS